MHVQTVLNTVKRMFWLQFYAAILLCATTTEAQSRSTKLLVSVLGGPSSGIYKVEPETGGSTRLPLPTKNYLYGVAYDHVTETVFWSDFDNGYRISEAKVDGSGYRLLSNTTVSTQCIMYDKYRDTLYYDVGHELHSLVRSSLAEGKLFSMYPGSQIPQGTRKRLLYVIDETQTQVMRHHVGGAHSKVLFTGSDLYGLAVPPSGDAVYAGSYTGVLYKYSLVSGALATHTLPSGIRIYRLEVSRHHIYIVDLWTDIAWRASLTNLNSWTRILEVTGSFLRDTTLITPRRPGHGMVSVDEFRTHMENTVHQGQQHRTLHWGEDGHGHENDVN